MFVQKEFLGSFPIQKLSAVYTTYKSDRGFFFFLVNINHNCTQKPFEVLHYRNV